MGQSREPVDGSLTSSLATLLLVTLLGIPRVRLIDMLDRLLQPMGYKVILRTCHSDVCWEHDALYTKPSVKRASQLIELASLEPRLNWCEV